MCICVLVSTAHLDGIQELVRVVLGERFELYAPFLEEGEDDERGGDGFEEGKNGIRTVQGICSHSLA